jgi:transposase-like protein
MSSDDTPTTPARTRRPKKMLSPSAKYDVWLQLIRGEVTIAQAAVRAGVDRSTILRVRTVTQGALGASTPGGPARAPGTRS